MKETESGNPATVIAVERAPSKGNRMGEEGEESVSGVNRLWAEMILGFIVWTNMGFTLARATFRRST